jgi:hypothetical protein
MPPFSGGIERILQFSGDSEIDPNGWNLTPFTGQMRIVFIPVLSAAELGDTMQACPH